MKEFTRLSILTYFMWIIMGVMNFKLCMDLCRMKEQVVLIEKIENAKTLKEYEVLKEKYYTLYGNNNE